MFKRKWVVFKESKNFRIYIPLKLFKKIEKRAKKGLSTTIGKVEDIRIEAKDPVALGTILETFLKMGGQLDVNNKTETADPESV